MRAHFQGDGVEINVDLENRDPNLGALDVLQDHIAREARFETRYITQVVMRFSGEMGDIVAGKITDQPDGMANVIRQQMLNTPVTSLGSR